MFLTKYKMGVLNRTSHLNIRYFRCHLPCSLIILSASVIVDSFYYGKVTVSLWNFTKFNFLKGGSSHFGKTILTDDVKLITVSLNISRLKCMVLVYRQWTSHIIHNIMFADGYLYSETTTHQK